MIFQSAESQPTSSNLFLVIVSISKRLIPLMFSCGHHGQRCPQSILGKPTITASNPAMNVGKGHLDD
jgi:hypothetical protein